LDMAVVMLCCVVLKQRITALIEDEYYKKEMYTRGVRSKATAFNLRIAYRSGDGVAEDRHVRDARRRHLQWCHQHGRGTIRAGKAGSLPD
jgi:hypothetical protein